VDSASIKKLLPASPIISNGGSPFTMRYKNLFLLIPLILLASCARQPQKPVVREPIVVQNNPFFDASPSARNASYIYAPGLLGSELIMGRYCPEFVASTSGEKISWKVGGHVIGKPHTAVIFPEVDVYKPSCFTANPIKMFLNRIRQDMYPMTAHFMYERYGITVIDNPTSNKTVANYGFHFSRGNIAQKDDIAAYAKTYAQHVQDYPNTDVILYGDSRGAATTLNFIAMHKPEQVKAAVLEGAFDAMPHVMKHCLYSDKEPSVEKRLTGTLSMLMRRYRKNAPAPYDYAERITDEIPLLFVTSLKDWVVPPQCTFRLYTRLKERGFTNVHILVLQRATHPCYMLDDAADRELYETVVHAFYKQYNLPHNSAKAAAGASAFACTQPSVRELKAMYPMPRCGTCV